MSTIGGPLITRILPSRIHRRPIGSHLSRKERRTKVPWNSIKDEGFWMPTAKPHDLIAALMDNSSCLDKESGAGPVPTKELRRVHVFIVVRPVPIDPLYRVAAQQDSKLANNSTRKVCQKTACHRYRYGCFSLNQVKSVEQLGMLLYTISLGSLQTGTSHVQRIAMGIPS
jgi:hypothetical protein